MIRNSNLEMLDVFLVYARPIPKTKENFDNLINGKWFIQTIGDAAEVLKIKLTCKWDVVQQILGYATTKDILTVTFLDFEKKGAINGIPDYDIAQYDDTNPTYVMTFEMAVIPDV